MYGISFPFLFQRLLWYRYPHSAQASPQGGSGQTSRFLQNPAVQPLKRLEVAVHSTKEWYPMAQMSDHGSYASTDGPMTFKTERNGFRLKRGEGASES
jgi:hypothetical protein